MKKKGLKAVGVVSLMGLFVTVLASCAQPYKSGNEVGKYYFDHNGEEYNITLLDEGKVEFKVGDENLTGSYRLEDGKITIKLSNKEEIVISYSNEEMSFNYDNVDMTFIRALDYKLTFNSNGGSKVADVTVRNGRLATEPANPTRQQYKFVGWFKDEALKNQFNFATDEITADTTLYAKWSYIDIVNTITYKNDDIVKTTNPTKDVVEGKPFILEVPTLANDYVFDGWYLADGTRLTDKNGNSLQNWNPELGNVEVSAKYVVPFTYTELEDGTIKVEGSEKTRSLEEIIIPAMYDGKKVTEVGEFKEHLNVKSVTLPKSLEVFSEVAFIASPVLEEYKIEEGGKFSVADGVLFTDEGATLVAYPINKAGAEYTVPNNVTRIANRAFSGVMIRDKMDLREYFGNLTKVTLPANIVSIGEYSFYQQAKLKTVEFAGESNVDLTIGSYAFSVVPLESFELPKNTKVIGEGAFASDLNHTDRMPSFNKNLVIPEGVREIGANAFMVNREMESVKLPKSLEVLGEGAFNGCSMLAKVEFTEGIKIKTIPAAAFMGCYSLVDIVLPVGIKEIGEQALENTGMTSIVIPEGVAKIGTRAFAECDSLESITFPKSLESLGRDVFTKCGSLGADGLIFAEGNELLKVVDGVVYNKDMTELVLYPRTRKEKAYVMPDTVVRIPDGAFRENQYIASITLSKNLKEIPAWAFYNIPNLKSIVIPASVESLGDNAFRSSKCTSITFEEGSKLKSIGKESFNGAKVEKLVFPEGFTTIGIDAFKSISNGIVEIVLPSTVNSIPEGAFEGSKLLKKITVAEGNKKYKSVDGVLYTADGTVLLNYPAGLNSTEVTIPEGVTRVGNSAFYGCAKLVTVNVPTSLREIGNKSFYSLKALKTMDVSKVTSFGNRAFYNCSALVNPDPSNAEFIDAEAFYGCTKLTKLTISSKLDVILKGTFQKTGITELVVPGNIKRIGEYAFSGTSITKLVIEEGVVDILNNAFSASNVLAEVKLPNSLEYIGDSVFDCSAFNKAALTTITIPANVKHIGKNVFKANVLTEIKVDENNKYFKIVDGKLCTIDGKTVLAEPLGKAE